MRLEERCTCGAEIVLDFETGRRAAYSLESDVARKQIGTFRRAHKPCLKRLGETAPTNSKKQAQEKGLTE